MKKAFVLLLALAVLGGAAFAEDVGYTLTGSASLTWGYDLNTEAHGFTNSADATLTVPFIAKQSATKGEEAITGQITIKNFEYKMVDKISADPAQTMTAGSIEAKILFPSNLYLMIASKPSFEINKAESFAPWVNDEFEDANGQASAEIASAGGFSFGMTGDFNFALKVGSTNKHDTAPATTYAYTAAVGTGAPATGVEYYYNDATKAYVAYTVGVTIEAGVIYYTRAATVTNATNANDYHFGADVGYALGDLATIGASFIYGSFKDDPATMGFGVSVASTPIEGLDLALGFDYAKVATSAMDLSFTADYTIADLLSFGAGVYYGKPNLENDYARLDAKVRVGLLAVENLTLEAGVDLWDLIADPANDPMLVLVGGKASYKAMLDDVNYIKPYAEGGYELNDKVLAVKAGVEAMFFPLTTFTLDFTAGELAENDVTGGTNAFKDDKGIFTFKVTIKY